MKFREQLAYRLWEFRFTRHFARFCRTHRIAAINPHYPGDTAFTFDRAIEKERLGLPLIISFHGTDLTAIAAEHSASHAAWQELLTRRTVVACSANMTTRIYELFNGAVTALTVHNGIDASRFGTSGPEDREPLPAQNCILSVGRFEPKKGQATLVAAFARIANAYPDLHLVLVGARDASLNDLEKAVRRQGLASRVHFFVDVPHRRMPAFFRAAKVFALPSEEEPFGIVILEAALSTLPVVASRVGGIPEIISDGETGRLVTPRDPNALAGALRSMLDDPEGSATMAARLRAHVLAHFTWRSAHDRYLDTVASAKASPRLRTDENAAVA